MIGYSFSNDNAVNRQIKHYFNTGIFSGEYFGMFKHKVCFASLGNEYLDHLNLYIYLRNDSTFPQTIQELNNAFTGIEYEIVARFYESRNTDAYYGYNSKLHLTEPDKHEHEWYIVKLNLKGEFTPIAKYVLTYFYAIVIRMFTTNEGYVTTYKRIEGEDIIDYLVRINTNLGQPNHGVNSNHLLSERSVVLNRDSLLFVNNNGLVNAYFINQLDLCPNFFGDSLLEIGGRISQNKLFKYINETVTKLKEEGKYA
jgi:hypothetical protein